MNFYGSDEIEIWLPLLNFLNILEYIWWLLNSDLQLTDIKSWLKIFLIISSQKNLEPKRYSQKFSKFNWEKLAWRHLLKPPKYWNCKVLIDNIAAAITQLNSLFDPLSVDV